MRTLKWWLSYLHVKCFGSVSRTSQNYDNIVFRGDYFWCFWFHTLFYTHQTLCMIECWKKSTCQYLFISLVPHFTSCFRILKIQKKVMEIVQPSNVCFRGVFASVHGQQLHSLEASVKHLLVIHFHTLSEAFQDNTWDYNPFILIQYLKKLCINLTLLDDWCMKNKWNMTVKTISLSSTTFVLSAMFSSNGFSDTWHRLFFYKISSWFWSISFDVSILHSMIYILLSTCFPSPNLECMFLHWLEHW